MAFFVSFLVKAYKPANRMSLLVTFLGFLNLCSCEGTNILLNKPSIQSQSYLGQNLNFGSFLGNDGNPASTSMTKLVGTPYWQGDLQGYYKVFNITLLSPSNGFETHLRNASVSVSSLDMTCPGSDVTSCGQWPNQVLSGTTIVFSCSLTRPVRFVRIWKEANGHIPIAEVEAIGKKIGMEFVQSESTKVSTTSSSLSVSIAAECASTCFNSPHCIAFSFRQGGQLNCLLATDVAVTSDIDWSSYTIKEC